MLASCTGPLGMHEAPSPYAVRDRGVLDESVQRAIEREIAGLPPEGRSIETEKAEDLVSPTVSERLDELDALGPATATGSTPFDLGADLTGADQSVLDLPISNAVASAVEHNLPLRSSRLQPAINREDLINAAAAFDFVLFASADLTKTDEPTPRPIIGTTPIGTGFDANERYRFETGISKDFTTGGTAVLSTDLTRFNNLGPGISFDPDPAYTAAVRLGITQPLLRGFGEDVNTAQIRLAGNSETRALEQLRGDLMSVAEATEFAYWELLLRWREVEIRQWLIDEGERVRKVLEGRRDYDVKDAEYTDAVARVESRKADLIRARRELRRSSDNLKRIINDPEYPVGSEIVLRPVDVFIDSAFTYDLTAMLREAIALRPEVRQAQLGIDDALIRQTVAANDKLPRLDLGASIAYLGLENSAADAYGNLTDGDFVDYVVGLNFEYPLGNRGPEARFRQARLRAAQSRVGYRSAVQTAVADVKGALRSVVTNFELIGATRATRLAQAENLRSLLALEETGNVDLTPEFLNLKFQRQESLAQARQQELQALVNFDQSLAALRRAMGTSLRERGIAIEVDGIDDREDDGNGFDAPAS